MPNKKPAFPKWMRGLDRQKESERNRKRPRPRMKSTNVGKVTVR